MKKDDESLGEMGLLRHLCHPPHANGIVVHLLTPPTPHAPFGEIGSVGC